jgi:predicted permease
MSVTGRLIVIAALIVVSMAGGYFARRVGLLRERAATWIMTIVAVLGYPIVSFLSIWGTPLKPGDFWLTSQAVIHMGVMTLIGLGVGRFLTKDRGELGLFGIAAAIGNNGFTMGGFILYLLYGEAGLGLANIYFLLFGPAVVLMHYPIARRYSAERPGGTLAGLLLRSIFDWRSIGLPMTLASIWLSMAGVPRPAFIADWAVLDVLMFTLTPLAYFGIGLRLHAQYAVKMRRLIAGLAVLRFVGGAAVGAGLFALTTAIAWDEPWGGLAMNVCLIESFVPMAVTVVAVANMFNLRPREASMLFVVNTVAYLLLVLPVVMWVFGR